MRVDKSEGDPNDSSDVHLRISVDSSEKIEGNIEDADIHIDSTGVKIIATDY